MLFNRSEYYQYSLKINNLNREKIFLVGLAIKLFLIFFINPDISTNLFLPFLKNSFENISFDPWNNFLNSGGQINSFPYGLVMLICYFPLSFIGNLLDKYIIDYNFFELFFKLTSLIFDYILLISLNLITENKNKNLLFISYWISPIVIYITYIHGQLDIVPIAILIFSLFLIKLNKFMLAGLFFALAFSTKFSMLIALPFILIYIYKRKGFEKEFFIYSLTFFITIFLFFYPFLYSSGFSKMVLETKELNRLYTVFIFYGSNLKLYIVPVVYIFSLYLFWRLNRITQDLFFVSIGIGFLSILVFLPPSTGWILWIIPFITYYQIISKKDLFLISFLYNFLYIFNIYFYPNLLNLDFSNLFFSFDKSFKTIFSNILFTLQQSFGLLIALKMYLYGLKRNNFFSTINRSLLIILSGNKLEIIELFLNSLKNIFYKKDIDFIFTRSLINKTSINNNSFKQLNINNEKDINTNDKIIYYPNYISENISKIDKNLFDNQKSYNLLVNNSQIDLSLLIKKVNININILDFNFEILNQIHYQDIRNNYLIFAFKNLNKERFNDIEKYSLVTFFPLGFLHNKLFNLFISISSLNVDIELLKGQKIVKMEIEGSPSKEDISQIAIELMPDIDDLSLNVNGWEEGYIGIMQIILIANILSILKNKSF